MRSLSREAKFNKRVKVIELRRAGHSYVQIASQLNLSRTGVFDICKRHAAAGILALRDAPGGRVRGERRMLAPEQERLVRQQIVDGTPDQFDMLEPLWCRTAVSRLIERQLGIVLAARTLSLYLERWGFTVRRPKVQAAGPQSFLLDQWLTERYPLVLAKAKAEGGEINWGGDCPLRGENADLSHAAAEAQTSQCPFRGGRRGLSMISAITNKGQLRWVIFQGPLDASNLLGFLRRLIKGASKKVFLIMDDLAMLDDILIQVWLVEHEEAIEAFRLPAHGLCSA